VGKLLRWLGAEVAAEQDRFFYWIPVFYGAGVVLYFALPEEPSLFACLLAACISAALVGLWRRGLASLVIGGGLASLTVGLAMGKVSSDLAAGPVLGRELRSAAITGWVELVDPRAAGGERIVVRTFAIEGLATEATPRRIRIRIPAGQPTLTPGDAISVRASLLPPAGPALPGAYDFARAAWFQGLGAVGSARVRPELASIAEPMPPRLRMWGPVERLRQGISRRITAALPGETGAIAAALITGERGGISEATNQAYRDSGIFHILSISGLHMSIFAGAVYFSSRLLFSLVPILALQFEIKKWAAVAGLLGTGGYLLISGGSPPAVRSAIMLAVMFVAILLDRPALALRNVAFAALVILLVAPESVIDVGFQMSFAAVVSLIAGVEAWQAWRRSRATTERRASGILSTAAAFAGTITLTTLIATVAVAPFAVYHFHKSTQLAVLANLVAVPICNLLVMPAALGTLLVMPFGLEVWPLKAMGLGIEGMSWVATRVAAMPGAVTLVPAIRPAGFALMICGGIWLCLWGGHLRLAGLIPIALGIMIAPWLETPDVIVGGGGTLIGVRGSDGQLAVIGAGRSSFELERWLEHEGDRRPAREVGAGQAISCDAVGCRAVVRGIEVAIPRHAAALGEDCARAHLVVWLGRGAPICEDNARGRLITREGAAKEGTHVVYFRGSRSRPNGELPTDRRKADGIRSSHLRDGSGMPLNVEAHIVTVGQWRGRRPWTAPRLASDSSGRRN
jgi:competence protein ComEC